MKLHRWRAAWLAARRIFRLEDRSGRAEFDQWLADNPGARQVLDQYADEDALIREAVFCNEVDTAAAWDKLALRAPELQGISVDQFLPPESEVQYVPWSRRYRPWLIAASLLLGFTAALCYPPIYNAIFKHNTRMTTTTNPPVTQLPGDASLLKPGRFQLFLTLPDSTVLKASRLPHRDTSIFDKVVVYREGEGTLVYKTFRPFGKKPSVFSLSTPRGGWYTVVLPDRTQVSLNAFSTLSFTSAFGKTDRLLSLEGEACIQTGPQQPGQPPMVVKISRGGAILRIISPSTFMNVTAYADDSDTRVTLLKGAVQIEDSTATDYGMLAPGDQYMIPYERKPLIWHHVDTSEVIAWRSGMFVFNNRSITEIMRPIARWYDADLRFHDPPQDKFSLTVSRTQPIPALLDMMSASKKVRFLVDSSRITVTH